jgi:membrane-associated phospholipid phosphatase
VNRSLAQALSVVFHPLLLPTYLFAVILYYMPSSTLTLPMRVRWIVLAMIFFTTFIIPAVAAFTMVRLGYLDSMEMDRREQRGFPLLFTGVCYAATSYLFYSEPTYDAVFYFVMGIIAASVFLAFAISQFWKISAHSIGMGGAIGLLLVLNKLAPEAMLIYPIIVAVFVAGVVMSARLALQAHTPSEVYAGFGICGAILSMAAVPGPTILVPKQVWKLRLVPTGVNPPLAPPRRGFFSRRLHPY